MYTCGRCHRSVDKFASRCPGCHAQLAGIRCTSCLFSGPEGAFPGDRCPKCGNRVFTGGGSAPKPLSPGERAVAIGLGVFLLAAAIGVGCYFAFRPSAPAGPSAESPTQSEPVASALPSSQAAPPTKPAPPPVQPTWEDHVAALKHEQQAPRLRAAKALAAMGPTARPALPAILAASDDQPDAVRTAIDTALQRIGMPSRAELPGLAGLVKHPKLAIRLRAIVYLTEADFAEANEPLAAVAATEPIQEIWELAAKALFKRYPRFPDTADRLAALLNHSDQAKRSFVAFHLADLPRDGPVLRMIAKCLRNHGQTEQISVLQAVGRDDALRDLPKRGRDGVLVLGALASLPGAATRLLAIRMLADLKDDAEPAVPDLAWSLYGNDEASRTEALLTLQALGPVAAGATRELAQVVDRDPDFKMKMRAVRVLKAIGPGAREAVPVLIQQFPSADPDLAAEAVLALGKIGKPAVPLLVEKLDDRQPIVRLGAVQSLKTIGPDAAEAIPDLKKRQKTESVPAIRTQIAAAIKAIAMPPPSKP